MSNISRKASASHRCGSEHIARYVAEAAKKDPAANRMDAAGLRCQTLARAPDVQYVSRSPKASRAMTVFKEPAGHTLEIVPTFERFHAPDHGVHIDQRAIAAGTPQRGCRNLRVLRHGCRPHRASSTTVGMGGRILAHAGDWSNRLAARPSRNPVQLAVAVSVFRASR